jgi:hypothetical protein
MGFPAAGLASTPRGGFAPSGNAPNGSTIGQATVSAPATNPDAPAVGSSNAVSGMGSAADASSLASAASNAASQSAPTAATPGGERADSLLQLIMSLVSGGAGGPQLSNLARTLTMGG